MPPWKPPAVAGSIVTLAAAVPWTSRTPRTRKLALAAIFTTVPGDTVMVAPLMIVVSPVTSTSPDHVADAVMVPDTWVVPGGGGTAASGWTSSSPVAGGAPTLPTS